MYRLLLLAVAVLAACTPQDNSQQPPEATAQPAFKEITLTTADSVAVHGVVYEADKAAPTILLFHQGGANVQAEYESIIPKLRAKGYNIIAIDQRLGGQLFGQYNRTVAAIGFTDFSSNGWGYCDAYPDLEASLQYAKAQGFTGPLVAWGSSYSAALVFQLAAKHPGKLAGVLAFSPASGAPLADCQCEQYFAELDVPAFIFRPGSEMEYPSAQEQLAKAKDAGLKTHVAPQGVHGSSMLVASRTGDEADSQATWAQVEAFLEEVTQ